MYLKVLTNLVPKELPHTLFLSLSCSVMKVSINVREAINVTPYPSWKKGSRLIHYDCLHQRFPNTAFHGLQDNKPEPIV